MYNVAKNQKTDMSESKMFPNRKCKEEKLKRIIRNLQEDFFLDSVIYCYYSFLNLIGQTVLKHF